MFGRPSASTMNWQLKLLHWKWIYTQYIYIYIYVYIYILVFTHIHTHTFHRDSTNYCLIWRIPCCNSSSMRQWSEFQLLWTEGNSVCQALQLVQLRHGRLSSVSDFRLVKSDLIDGCGASNRSCIIGISNINMRYQTCRELDAWQEKDLAWWNLTCAHSILIHSAWPRQLEPIFKALSALASQARSKPTPWPWTDSRGRRRKRTCLWSRLLVKGSSSTSGSSTRVSMIFFRCWPVRYPVMGLLQWHPLATEWRQVWDVCRTHVLSQNVMFLFSYFFLSFFIHS